MSMEKFSPKEFKRPVEDILPDVSLDTGLKEAKDECSETVETLISDVSGIGPKAAERYLLRFEYGFNTTDLTEHYGVSKSTLSKQTNQVHRRILSHPILARTVGQFRSERTGLSRPVSNDRQLWNDVLHLHSKPIYTTINFLAGDVSTSYSWAVDLRADLVLNDKTRRLRCNYIIDEEYGVLLKRILRGFSRSNLRNEFSYESHRTCHIYTLPHPEIPDSDETLLDGLESHVSYDIKRVFERSDWQSIEKRICFLASDDSLINQLPEFGLPEKIIGKQTSSDIVQKYTQEIHRRNNFEQILRMYPYTRIENLPLKTVDLLWNGSLENNEDYLENIFSTSQPHYHPGPNRTIWSISKLN